MHLFLLLYKVGVLLRRWVRAALCHPRHPLARRLPSSVSWVAAACAKLPATLPPGGVPARLNPAGGAPGPLPHRAGLAGSLRLGGGWAASLARLAASTRRPGLGTPLLMPPALGDGILTTRRYLADSASL